MHNLNSLPPFCKRSYSRLFCLFAAWCVHSNPGECWAATRTPHPHILTLPWILVFKHFPCKSKVLAKNVKSCASGCWLQSSCLISALPLNVVSAGGLRSADALAAARLNRLWTRLETEQKEAKKKRTQQPSSAGLLPAGKLCETTTNTSDPGLHGERNANGTFFLLNWPPAVSFS